MSLDAKGLLVAGVMVSGLIAGGYFLGLSQRPDTTTISSERSIAPVAMPANHPAMPSAAATGANMPSPTFSHFRVGNRNVKGMAAVNGVVWVGTSGGVLRYDLATDDYKLFDVSSGSLISNGVFHVSLLDDRIAVGTYGGGLSLYDPKQDKWRNYNIPDGLADQFVYDIQRVSSGDIWIATWSGVNRVKGGQLDNPAQWETYNLDNTHGGLPNDWVYGLEEGKDGAMWFATEKGVARFKDGKWENWQHDAGVGAPFELVKDDIKFSSDPGSASRHHAQQKTEQGLDNINVAYNPNYIVSLQVDRQGIVWGGTWGAGLTRFDGKVWQNFTVKDGLPSNHVFMLHMDEKGQLWVGTSHGLAKLNADGKSFTVYTRQNGLFSDNVFSMTEASDGSVWVGSFGGVARLTGQL